jgi:hypothetical protein
VVTFYDGANLLGSDIPNATGQAQFISNIPGLGKHTVTASYAGDPDFAAATAPAKTVEITQ